GLSGLQVESLIRLGFLAEYASSQVIGVIGEISPERHQRLRGRLANFLLPHPASIRRTIGIIPARYASARFPGKPLALIAGKPLLQHVVERCQKAKALSEIIVATDDPRIAEAARNFSRVEMTGAEHQSGTDRIAEVAARQKCDAVLNIQGDERLIDPSAVDAVAGGLSRSLMSPHSLPIQTVLLNVK